MSGAGAVLGSLALGALGWFALEFIGRPVRSYFDLRRKIRTEMLRYEYDLLPSYSEHDVRVPYAPSRDDLEKQREVRAVFRNLAAELTAFAQSEWFAFHFVKALGHDPYWGGGRVGIIAQDFGQPGEDRRRNYLLAAKALKFPDYAHLS